MDFGILILLFAGGCAGGLLAGLLGVGGGLIFVPIFTNYLFVLGIPDEMIARLIIANSMVAIFFAGISGSIKHHLNGDFYFKPVIISGAMASLASIATTFIIHHTTGYNKRAFSVIFISIAVYMTYRIFSEKPDKGYEIGEESSSATKFLQIGWWGGILAALSGVGGGIIMVPMLISMLNINIKKATAISLGIITVMALVSSVYFMSIQTSITEAIPYTYGLIIFPMVIPVVIGCIVCSPFGVALAGRIPEKTIQTIFAAFLVLVILNMVYHLWL